MVSLLLKRKKGNEFVEASMVLPLIILVSIGLMMLCMHFYVCLNAQVNLHMELNELSSNSEKIYHKEVRKVNVSISQISAAKYLIQESTVIRADDVIFH